jgi:hypothetical protein
MNFSYRSAVPIDFRFLSRISGIDGPLEKYNDGNVHTVVVQKDLVDLARPFIEYKFPGIEQDQDYQFTWSLTPLPESLTVYDKPSRDCSRFYSVLQYFSCKTWY